MIFTMTGHVASAMIEPLVVIPQDSAAGRRNKAHVEVDKVGIVGAVSLRAADPVRIVAGIAGCALVIDMKVVPFERHVTCYRAAAVAAIAQGIGRG
jgi:hypothetical protein